MSAEIEVLSFSGLSKRYGTEHALRDLSGSVGAGERILLLGPNGAGKSTLLRLLSGLSAPDAGTVVRGPGVESRPVHGRVAYLGHSLQLYAQLDIRENLELALGLSGNNQDVGGYLERWELSAISRKRVAALSKGQQFRAALARAMIHAPALILLDEPTTALDDKSVQLLLKELTNPGLNAVPPLAVVIASHDLARLGDWATRIMILKDGQLVAVQSGSKQAQLETYQRINR